MIQSFSVDELNLTCTPVVGFPLLKGALLLCRLAVPAALGLGWRPICAQHLELHVVMQWGREGLGCL